MQATKLSHKATIVLLALLGGLVASTWLDSCQAHEPADLVIINGRMFPTDVSSPQSPPQSLAVRHGRIVFVGADADFQKWIGPDTQRIDAAACTVTPGLNDAHVHFLSGSLSLAQIDLAEVADLDEIGKRITSFTQAHPDESVYVGRGWVYGTFPGGLPTREQLDRWINDRPAIMRCYDGHTVWVNSVAIRTAGVTKDTPDPTGGIIVRDTHGEPTGVFKESAQELIEKLMPQPTRAEKLNAIRNGIRAAHRWGVTCVQEAGTPREDLELYDALRIAGELKLRMHFALEGKPAMSIEQMDQLDQVRRHFSNLNIDAVKLYIDGVIEAHTAALLTNYANRPTRGLPEANAKELERVIVELDRRGWNVWVHAIGDGGIRMTLDAFEAAQRVNAERAKAKPRRHRLEHIESISAEDIPRFGKLGVIASMQPYHANPNSNIFNVWAANLGPERASRAWAWKSIQQTGGRLAFGSDWPVVSLDPLLGLHTATTRQTLDGQPADGFLPEQRLTLADAIRAYTIGSAYAESSEHNMGYLAEGMQADIVVWDKDLFQLKPSEVHKARALHTLVDGVQCLLP